MILACPGETYTRREAMVYRLPYLDHQPTGRSAASRHRRKRLRVRGICSREVKTTDRGGMPANVSLGDNGGQKT